MKFNQKTLILALAAAGSIVISAPIFAQGPAMPEAEQAQKSEQMQKRMHDRMEKHQAMMHDQLKITAEQEGAWKTFVEATKHNMQDRKQARPDRKQMEAMSAPAMMELRLERAKEHLGMMQKHVEAVKTFYAVLTPEQQKTFDQAHKRMHHRAQMMRMKHRGGMGGGHDMDHGMPKK